MGPHGFNIGIIYITAVCVSTVLTTKTTNIVNASSMA